MANIRPSVLIISFSEIIRDPRVMRQIGMLRRKFRVHVLGYGVAPEGIEGYYPVNSKGRSHFQKAAGVLMLSAKAFECFYWSDPRVARAEAALAGSQFDLIVANDIDTLPLALRVANGAPVVADAHEYAPREYEDLWRWRLLFQKYKIHLCETYLQKVSGMMTVCGSIAREYSRNFGVLPLVMTNAPDYHDLAPSPVDDGKVRIIHHGAAARSRHIEVMIETFKYLDERFYLDLMLVSNDLEYMAELKRLADPVERIRFRDPVPMGEIVGTTNDYDIGLFLLPPVNFNYAHALPNKFFEFVQARLAVAIGPSPEMAELVKRYDLGIVAASFSPDDLARQLNSLSKSEIEGFKRSSHQAARTLCAEANAELFQAEIDRVLRGMPFHTTHCA